MQSLLSLSYSLSFLLSLAHKSLLRSLTVSLSLARLQFRSSLTDAGMRSERLPGTAAAAAVGCKGKAAILLLL